MPDHLDDDTLNEYLDSALDPARRTEVETHLAACADCAVKLENLRALFAAIESVPDVPLERDLSSAVITALRGSGLHPRPMLRLIFAAQALAALILLGLAAPIALQALPINQTPQITQQAFAAIAHTLAEWSASLALARQTLTDAASALDGLPLPSLSLLAMGIGGLAVTLMWIVANSLLITQLNRRPTQHRL
jgi:anti-sigma factor RsiW